ncbi:hypothetical protein E2C01_082471 [Portunus trituberculatus]|uniref:Uncharacterized protein n=1 Tax=Portunus trituberculatus TaxID=210409 RepID=A0A5B7IYK5_PORTR|nr:hypothetical protein [Portunus trituberculatus]
MELIRRRAGAWPGEATFLISPRWLPAALRTGCGKAGGGR